MPNNCLFCDSITTNPKFCSKSCAAKQNNKIPKRKRKIFYCKVCSKDTGGYRREYCKTCNPNYVDWDDVTYAEITRLRNYQKNSRIRDLARAKYKCSGKPYTCYICGYSLHVEICHIKAISSYLPSAKIAEINDINNLVALCPNHHWELDKQLFSLVFSFLATFTLCVSNIGVQFY